MNEKDSKRELAAWTTFFHEYFTIANYYYCCQNIM